jgi:hypothetical protein
MGFFSWKTCDTNRSIANVYSDELTFDVYMITPDGRVFHETHYDGYGDSEVRISMNCLLN